MNTRQSTLNKFLRRGVLLGLAAVLALAAALAGCAAGAPVSGVPGSGADNPPRQVLYIPLDNRPLNYRDVLSLAEIAGVELLVPPADMLGQADGPGDAQAVGRWLTANAEKGQAWIISLDMLLYGGLAPSRTHGLGQRETAAQMQQLRTALAAAQKRQIPVYVLATSMRSAASSASTKQPAYFAGYGDQILRLSQLSDLAELQQASAEQLAALERLQKTIPPDVLQNYLNRRQVNLAALEEAVRLTAQGQITSLTVGRDDTTPHSFTRMELRRLHTLARELGTDDKIDDYPGADELGALLLARAVNRLEGLEPRVYVEWSAPDSGELVALYEDIPLRENAARHIRSGGGQMAANRQTADLVLAVNAPLHKVTDASQQPRENIAPAPQHRALAQRTADALRAGKPVAAADVAYANGGDAAFMMALADTKTLPKLAAYAGCNTAGNSLGLALAQGLIWSARQNDAGATAAAAQKRTLLTRLTEDWGYQAVIRPALAARQNPPLSAGTPLAAAQTAQLEEQINRELNKFLQTEINPATGVKSSLTDVKLPWNRLFELDFQLQVQ